MRGATPLLLGARNRASVASILAAGLDRQAAPSGFGLESPLPAHPNVRGPKYYH